MDMVRYLISVVSVAVLGGCADYDAELMVADQSQDTAPLSFAVISDVHFGSTTGEGAMVKVPRALKHLSSYGELDAFVVVGDLTESGKRSEYELLVRVFGDESNLSYPVDQFLFMMGNHDNYNGNAKSNYQKSLRPFNGGENYPFHSYCVIKGYPFITVSMFGTENNDIDDPSAGSEAYPEETIEWLEQKMALAARECPDKPIFVFTHMPPRWTSIGTWTEHGNGEAWCMSSLNPVLDEYPQAVVFAGHTHYTLGDPRSIHQGTDPDSEYQNCYTVINTSSTSYCEIPSDMVDEGVYPVGDYDVTEGMIVTELEGGDIEIRRYNTKSNEEIAPDKRWVLKAPFD